MTTVMIVFCGNEDRTISKMIEVHNKSKLKQKKSSKWNDTPGGDVHESGRVVPVRLVDGGGRSGPVDCIVSRRSHVFQQPYTRSLRGCWSAVARAARLPQHQHPYWRQWALRRTPLCRTSWLLPHDAGLLPMLRMSLCVCVLLNGGLVVGNDNDYGNNDNRTRDSDSLAPSALDCNWWCDSFHVSKTVYRYLTLKLCAHPWIF